jgi:hypothetical protein
MQNILAIFMFVLINFVVQIGIHFIPVVGAWAFFPIQNVIHVIGLLAADTSIGVLLYDPFFDQGAIKYIVYLAALVILLMTGGDLAREKLFLSVIIAIMFGTVYLICYAWKTFDTRPCLACSPYQLHENTPKYSGAAMADYQFSS